MLPRPRFARPTRVTVLIVVTALSLSMTAVAVAGGAMSVPTFVPKMADQVTNLDILRSQIKNYYGTPTAVAGAAATRTSRPRPTATTRRKPHRSPATAGAGCRRAIAPTPAP